MVVCSSTFSNACCDSNQIFRRSQLFIFLHWFSGVVQRVILSGPSISSATSRRLIVDGSLFRKIPPPAPRTLPVNPALWSSARIWVTRFTGISCRSAILLVVIVFPSSSMANSIREMMAYSVFLVITVIFCYPIAASRFFLKNIYK